MSAHTHDDSGLHLRYVTWILRLTGYLSTRIDKPKDERYIVEEGADQLQAHWDA